LLGELRPGFIAYLLLETMQNLQKHFPQIWLRALPTGHSIAEKNEILLGGENIT